MYEQIASNQKKTIALIIGFILLIATIGVALYVYYDNIFILILALGISIIMSAWSYFKGDKTILSISGARLIDPDKDLTHRKVKHLVDNLCITAGLPNPEVYIINDPSPNAFATGRDPKHSSIALTSGLIELLDKSELEGVIAHELSHIKNYDILWATVVVTLLGVVVLLSDWSMRFRFSRNNHTSSDKGQLIAVLAVFLIILSPLIARLVYFSISRKREYLADASGALLTRYPEGLASALKKLQTSPHKLKLANRATAALYIVNPFKNFSFSELFSTHPPIEKRIQKLNNMNV